MSEIKNHNPLRLIPGGDAAPESKPYLGAAPAAGPSVLDNPLLRQLTALADALDRDVAAIMAL